MRIIGYHAMMRDASWYANPGRATKYHIVTGNTVALCAPTMLLDRDTSIVINVSNKHMVCKRCAALKR